MRMPTSRKRHIPSGYWLLQPGTVIVRARYQDVRIREGIPQQQDGTVGETAAAAMKGD
jgi:hypothetical protein